MRDRIEQSVRNLIGQFFPLLPIDSNQLGVGEEGAFETESHRDRSSLRFFSTAQVDETRIKYSTPAGVRHTQWVRDENTKFQKRALKDVGIIMAFEQRTAVYEIFLDGDGFLNPVLAEVLQR